MLLHSDSAEEHLDLLILRCREMALQLNSNISRQVDKIAEDLFPPVGRSDAEALATLGDVAVPHLQHRGRMSVDKALAAIHALRLIGTRKANEALLTFAKDKREAVYTELSQAINPLLSYGVIEILKRRELLPDIIAKRL